MRIALLHPDNVKVNKYQPKLWLKFIRENVIAVKGFEPMTSGLWARRATSALYRYVI